MTDKAILLRARVTIKNVLSRFEKENREDEADAALFLQQAIEKIEAAIDSLRIEE